MIFAWDGRNRDHLARHGVTPEEAAFVVDNATPPFPQGVGDEKRRVWGPTPAGRFLQVIYVLKAPAEIAFDSIDPADWAALQGKPRAKIARVIHAMDLTPDMKRQLNRRRRRR